MSMVEALLVILVVEMMAAAIWLALVLRDVKAILTKLSSVIDAAASTSLDRRLIQEELLGAQREVDQIARELEQAKRELLSGRDEAEGTDEPVDVDSILHEDEDEESQVPLQVDPSNPPKLVSYSPKPGSPQRLCDCHGREVVPGDNVILWPNPAAEGAVWIICESGGGGK